MLELSEVSRSSGRRPVLVRVTLTCRPDAPTSILGLSSAATMAFFRLLDGTDSPDAGQVKIEGKPAAEARRGRISIVRIDRQGLVPSGRTVRGELARAASRAGLRAKDEDPGQAAARTGLKDVFEVPTKRLSTDQRIRLAVACARLSHPRLLLLDAPAAELSGETRQRLLADLPAMLDGCGATIVQAAASGDEARALGGVTLVLADGRPIQFGPTDAVFAYPANLVVAQATAEPALNTVRITMEGDTGRLADGSRFHPPPGLALPVCGACILAFRPDHLAFVRRDQAEVRFIVRAAGEETINGRPFLRLAFADATWLAPLPETPPQGWVLNAFVPRAGLMVFDAEGRAVSATPAAA